MDLVLRHMQVFSPIACLVTAVYVVAPEWSAGSIVAATSKLLLVTPSGMIIPAQLASSMCRAGLQNGQVLHFDLRHLRGPLSQRQLPQHLPVHSLAPLFIVSESTPSLLAANMFAVHDIALAANHVDGECYTLDTALSAGQRICTSACVHANSGTALHTVRQPQLSSMQYYKSRSCNETDK